MTLTSFRSLFVAAVQAKQLGNFQMHGSVEQVSRHGDVFGSWGRHCDERDIHRGPGDSQERLLTLHM